MICVSVVEEEVSGALAALTEASRVAQLVEIRLDALKTPEVTTFLSQASVPLLFTFRDVREGGLREIPLRERLQVLKEALTQGAAMVDLELAAGSEAFEELLAAKGEGQQVLSSFHDFSKTPPLKELQEIASRMKTLGVDLGKIVTTAQVPEDNLSVLSLIPWARKALGLKLVAFAMGPLGRISRVAAPILGAPFTYAALSGRAKAAPGQLEAVVLEKIFKYLLS